MDVEKGMQSEYARIKERNHRETENFTKYRRPWKCIQEEMFREFDQSTFDLGLQGFRRGLLLPVI